MRLNLGVFSSGRKFMVQSCLCGLVHTCTYIVVSNPELAKQVLNDNDKKLVNRHRNWTYSRLSRNGKGLIWADDGPRSLHKA